VRPRPLTRPIHLARVERARCFHHAICGGMGRPPTNAFLARARGGPAKEAGIAFLGRIAPFTRAHVGHALPSLTPCYLHTVLAAARCSDRFPGLAAIPIGIAVASELIARRSMAFARLAVLRIGHAKLPLCVTPQSRLAHLPYARKTGPTLLSLSLAHPGSQLFAVPADRAGHTTMVQLVSTSFTQGDATGAGPEATHLTAPRLAAVATATFQIPHAGLAVQNCPGEGTPAPKLPRIQASAMRRTGHFGDSSDAGAAKLRGAGAAWAGPGSRRDKVQLQHRWEAEMLKP
jgi:hypothetical protein